jgi:hypothetical protein
MSDDKKSFTVSDRRHFTAEGKARDEAAEPEPEAETETERREAAPPPSAASAAVAEDAGAGPADDDLGELPPFPADLLGLVGSLATQASVLLAGDPQTSRPPSGPELEAVRSIISLVDVLHEKTKGNRTPQEDRVLDAVRYELKMAYVARTRAGGA